MTYSHIPVKHHYACQSVERMPKVVHNPDMQNLKRIRMERGLSQAELAEMVGVGQGYISKVENGGMNITLDKIVAIAVALRVQPAQLFELPELQKRLLDALSEIPVEKQDAALVVLETMAGNRS